MAITNPSAIKFCNERVRVLADQIARVYSTISLFAAEFAAKELSTFIPDNIEEIVQDGSTTDGRTPISGHDVREMIALANDLLLMATGQNSRMPTVLKVSVNPK